MSVLQYSKPRMRPPPVILDSHTRPRSRGTLRQVMQVVGPEHSVCQAMWAGGVGEKCFNIRFLEAKSMQLHGEQTTEAKAVLRWVFQTVWGSGP